MTSTAGIRVLREFLYVDSDKVRALLGQLERGVPEETRETSQNTRSSGAGAKGFAWHQQDRADVAEIQRSLADSNYPALEEILDAEGILSDISSILASSERWTEAAWRDVHPPGTIVRMTLRGLLFDARYVAQQLAAFGAVVAGAQGLGVIDGTPGTRTQEKQARTNDPQLEDAIPLFGAVGDGKGVKIGRTFLQSIV